jgi:hypothetical protein
MRGTHREAFDSLGSNRGKFTLPIPKLLSEVFRLPSTKFAKLREVVLCPAGGWLVVDAHVAIVGAFARIIRDRKPDCPCETLVAWVREA